MSDLRATQTPIPGLLLIHLPVQLNTDGWFKENWHREKMRALGVPDLAPVQENLTHVLDRGVTRGFHAEPWDRLITVSQGRAFGAWVDLRAGATFGRTFTANLDTSTAVFVPRGVGNAHQTLQDGTTLSYLMDRHWTPESRTQGRAVHPLDPALRIDWPIARERFALSHRDATSPFLADVDPMPARGILVVGTETPLGEALAGALGDGCTTTSLQHGGDGVPDLSSYDALIDAHGGLGLRWRDDDDAWSLDWAGTAARGQWLTSLARHHRLRYVHVFADGVFADSAATLDEEARHDLAQDRGRVAALGEALALTVPRAIVVRTGWVIDDEGAALHDIIAAGRHCVPVQAPTSPRGRLTYVTDLATGIRHLLEVEGAEGIYNLTGDGPAVSAADVVRRVFTVIGADASVEERAPGPGDAPGAVLRLDRIKATGFQPGNAWLDVEEHLPTARPAGRDEPRSDVLMESADRPPVDPSDAQRPYRVLYVCTANICRSAYADVVSRVGAPSGIEFGSAGISALVSRPMDPHMARLAERHGAVAEHSARQLTHELMAEADLVIAMAAEHRRFILDEWPQFARKTYVIGHAARELGTLPDGTGREAVVEHLWRHRTLREGDEVADPYGRGDPAAEEAAAAIDAHLASLIRALSMV